MKRRKLIPGPALMVISILFLTAFQVYWLKQNYEREKKSLGIKTDVAFRETVLQLQVSKLKFDGAINDTANGKIKVFMNDDGGSRQINVRFKPRREFVSTVNVIRDRLLDSIKSKTNIKSGTIISLNQTAVTGNDSIRVERMMQPGDKGDHVFNFLYGVDSLQEPLRLTEIDSAYTNVLKEQRLNIPFSITKIENDKEGDDHDRAFNQVTVGFAHPVTYKLELGNTFPYLMRQITQPILFSILLLSIIISTFVLLYRNLLKQRRLAELKNEFISNITHELKTPIATVGVAIEALKNFNAIQDPERTKEYLDISQNELQRLSILVDKVLKLSMFESKRIELKKEEFDLKQLVEETMNVMKLQFEKHKATVSMQTEAHPFTIEADRLHITSVLYNLLDNALKYSKENPVIEVKLTALPGDIYELKISDNGIGISKEYQRKIFDKFFRVPMGNQHNTKGYGLGLSYVSEIVQRHMGFITVDSELGKGTTFTVKLPKKEADVIYIDNKRRIVKETWFMKKSNKDE